MTEPWNDKCLSLPTVNTSFCQINFSVNSLKSYCNSIIHTLSEQLPLHKESAILSRFLYKFDKKFRSDIGYRNFKKVNTALHKYLSLTITRDVQSFIDLLPTNNEIESYLPTRQMLEYILLRLMAFSKLMYRIAACSEQAAIYYFDRIKQGQSHWMSLMPYALLSKVCSMVLVLLQHSCNWYNHLYSFVEEFPYKGANFLPKDYNLPQDLKEWIDLDNLNHPGHCEWINKLDINVDCDENSLSENILKHVNKINNGSHDCDHADIQLPVPRHKMQTENVIHKNYDEGISISRESFKQLTTPIELNNSLLNEMGGKHAIENVTDQDSLIKFIEDEEEFRYETNTISLTKHLSFMQWQALKMGLLKYNTARLNREKLEKKVQKVWQRKCLAYS